MSFSTNNFYEKTTELLETDQNVRDHYLVARILLFVDQFFFIILFSLAILYLAWCIKRCSYQFDMSTFRIMKL